MTKHRTFTERPTRQQVLDEVAGFFDLLKKGDAEAAGAIVAHRFDDWWPHQVRSLWQDLVVPWLEEKGEKGDLDDDQSWRDPSWMAKIDVDLSPPCWDGDSFYVNVLYDGASTDVSAEFTVEQQEEGWVLRRDIIHVT
jgi:hypothetical protein